MAGEVRNVNFDVQGDILTIQIDLSQEYGTSSTGKSLIVATTGGNVDVPDTEDVKAVLTIYRPLRQVNRGGRGAAGYYR